VAISSTAASLRRERAPLNVSGDGRIVEDSCARAMLVIGPRLRERSSALAKGATSESTRYPYAV
jgi:hypothetical protein